MSLLRKLPEVAVRRPLLQREKRILGLAAFVAVVFLLTNGVPALLDVFRSRNLQIENRSEETRLNSSH